MTFEGGILVDRKRIVCLLIPMLLMVGQVFAATSDMDKIKEPIDNIIKLAQYIIGSIATLGLFGAAVAYMTSGSNIQAREGAKIAATCCVMGLLVVVIAPFGVSYILGGTP